MLINMSDDIRDKFCCNYLPLKMMKGFISAIPMTF